MDLSTEHEIDENPDNLILKTAIPVESVALEKAAAPLKRRKAYYLQLCEDHRNIQEQMKTQ